MQSKDPARPDDFIEISGSKVRMPYPDPYREHIQTPIESISSAYLAPIFSLSPFTLSS